MSSPDEIFNGNRYGLRCITPKDIRMIKKRVASHNFSPNGDKLPKESLISKFARHLGKSIAKQRIRD